MNRIARQGLAVAVVLLTLTALFTPHRVTLSHHTLPATPRPAALQETVAPHDVAGEFVTQGDEPDVIIDLYGNDLSHAVATYSIDALGSPYEVHSPQTELPRLGSPKT